MSRTVLMWGGLIVLMLVAFSIGGRRGLRNRRSEIELQEASVPLQPATQPALLASAVGFQPSGSNYVDRSGVYA